MDKWDETTIRRAINKIVKATGQKTMPTHTEMISFYGNQSLSNAVRRHGGTKHWAELMGLNIKDCESKTGEDYEAYFKEDLWKNALLECEMMPIRYPYDVLVDGSVKVDVKASHLFKVDNAGFYTCNLSKKYQTCDVFVVYCLNDSGVEKTYIIPAAEMKGKNQLSIGEHSSKYDQFIDRWDIIKKYANFMRICN